MVRTLLHRCGSGRGVGVRVGRARAHAPAHAVRGDGRAALQGGVAAVGPPKGTDFIDFHRNQLLFQTFSAKQIQIDGRAI